MRNQKPSNSISPLLLLARIAQVVFLIVVGFLMILEHRAHYLAALPYVLLAVAVVTFVWLLSGHRKHRARPGSRDDSPRSGERS